MVADDGQRPLQQHSAMHGENEGILSQETCKFLLPTVRAIPFKLTAASFDALWTATDFHPHPQQSSKKDW